MASRDIIDGIEAAALECPLCLERFKNPKSLPCIHSFCLGCLEKWLKESGGRLSCPTCREGCKVPKGGLKQLQNNIFIIGLLDYVATLEQKSAPVCACDREACFFCRDCDELYCTDCRGAHERMKISKNHSIITLTEYSSIDPVERFASKSLNCTEHNMPLQFFCESCKKPVCVGCTLVQHPKSDNHNIVDVKNAFEAFLTHATQLIETSDAKLLNCQKVAEQLKEKEAGVRSNYTKSKTDITRQADDLHRLIDCLKEEQLQHLESCCKPKLKILESEIRDLEFSIAKLSSMRGITHNLVSSPNQVMALMSSSGVSGRLEELLKEEENVNIEIHESVDFEYNPNSRLSTLANAVGPKQVVSLEKSIVSLVILPLVQCKTINIATRNSSGKTVYIVEAKVKCFQVKHHETKIKEEKVLLEYKGYHDGSYQINSDMPFKCCTLISLIINGFDVYFNITDFNSFGHCLLSASGFKQL